MTLLVPLLLPLVSMAVMDIDLDTNLGIILDALVIAILCGASAAAIDMAIFYWYGPEIAPSHYATHRIVKYNRGVSYLDLMLWPVLAYYWLYRSKAVAIGLGSTIAVLTMICASTTAKLALAIGFSGLVLSLISATMTATAMSVAVVILGVGTPVIFKGISALLRDQSLLSFKASGIHRLEFWDYMANRVWERPFFGWGLQSAPALPITPEELVHYHVVTSDGIGHEHNLWLQVWIETGVIGAFLFLTFALYVLSKTIAMPVSLRPFALAACATGLTMTVLSYNLTADSWWAAIAWVAFLFLLIINPTSSHGPTK